MKTFFDEMKEKEWHYNTYATQYTICVFSKVWAGSADSIEKSSILKRYLMKTVNTINTFPEIKSLLSRKDIAKIINRVLDEEESTIDYDVIIDIKKRITGNVEIRFFDFNIAIINICFNEYYNEDKIYYEKFFQRIISELDVLIGSMGFSNANELITPFELIEYTQKPTPGIENMYWNANSISNFANEIDIQIKNEFYNYVTDYLVKERQFTKSKNELKKVIDKDTSIVIGRSSNGYVLLGIVAEEKYFNDISKILTKFEVSAYFSSLEYGTKNNFCCSEYRMRRFVSHEDWEARNFLKCIYKIEVLLSKKSGTKKGEQ